MSWVEADEDDGWIRNEDNVYSIVLIVYYVSTEGSLSITSFVFLAVLREIWSVFSTCTLIIRNLRPRQLNQLFQYHLLSEWGSCIFP